MMDSSVPNQGQTPGPMEVISRVLRVHSRLGGVCSSVVMCLRGGFICGDVSV